MSLFMVKRIFHTSMPSLSDKRLTIAQLVSLAVAICVIILFFSMSTWGIVFDLKSQKAATKGNYYRAYLIHRVFIFKTCHLAYLQLH